jgi:cyclic pyranopterin phosphate synthase
MQNSALEILKPDIPTEDLLVDQFGRSFDYLRISVNERCNLRCIYCMPEKGIRFTRNAALLQTEEIIRVIKIVSLIGIQKMRFTGGEPLLNKDIIKLVKIASQTPNVNSVHLTTNGLLLGDKINDLKSANLSGLNISLDTLNSEKFERIARRSGLESVITNMYSALEAGIPNVKINVVLMRGINDNEMIDFVELTRNNPLTVRFIELMPFDSHQIWKTGHFMGVELGLKRLQENYDSLQPTAGSSTEHQIYRVPGYRGKIALIPSYTRNMCTNCSRVRLTADGKIRNCLYSDKEYNILELLRNGSSDDEIKTVFKSAMWAKLSDGWEAQHTQETNTRKSMTQIGG